MTTSRAYWTIAVLVALGFSAGAVRGQLVFDGGSHVFSGVTNLPFNNLVVGSNLPSTLLTITDGAKLTNRYSLIGLNSSSSSNRVVISGPAAEWQSEITVIGVYGSANELEISGGANVSAEWNFGLGDTNTSRGNLAVVENPGTRLVAGGWITAGYQGSSNTLIVRDGASVAGSYLQVGSGSNNSDNLFFLTDSDSNLVVTNEIRVGFLGSENKLIVSNGAAVLSGYTRIGNRGTNTVVVATGAGTRWTNFGDLTLGSIFSVEASGRNALLIVSNEANLETHFVRINGNRTLTPSYKLIVDGGHFRTKRGYEDFNVINGEAVLNNGSLTVGELVVTNSYGSFQFGGGILRSDSTRMDQWPTFGIGDGSTPAIFQVAGGKHTFTYGITIASNAALRGSGSFSNGFGTYTGRVICFGMIDAGSDANGLSLVGNLELTNSSVLATTLNGSSDTDYGHIAISSPFGAAGTFLLSVTNGFQPQRGNAFRPLRALAISNAFAQLLLPNLASGLVWDTANLYTAGELLVVDENEPLSPVNIIIDAVSSNAPGTFLLGVNIAANSLLITNSGSLASGAASVGAGVVASNNVVMVTGADSRWDTTGLLVFGDHGKSNSLTIRDDATVTAERFVIGRNALSVSNTVAIENGHLSVVNPSGTGELDIRRGVVNLSGGGLEADRVSITNAGTAAFEFHGGLLTTRAGTLNTFTLGSSSNVPATWHLASSSNSTRINGDLRLGTLVGSNSITLFAGSRLSIAGNTVMGVNAASRGNLMVISNAILTNTGSFVVGNSSLNRVVVSGTGSKWGSSGTVTVGSESLGNSALITNGAALTTPRITVGAGPAFGGSSNLLMVSGSNSIVSFGPIGGVVLVVGTNDNSSSNTALITSGGRILTTSSHIGTGAGTNNRVLVEGIGAEFEVRAGLTIGGRLNNGLHVNQGAFVDGTNTGSSGFFSDARIGTAGSGAFVTVADLGSRMSFYGDILVGTQGSNHTLNVLSGALVTSLDLWINSSTNARSNSITITGTDSRVSANDVRIGHLGSGARFNLESGGLLQFRNGLYVGFDTSSSNNQAHVDGATLLATNASAVMDVRRGTFLLSSGTVSIPTLLLTNANRSFFRFNGGHLSVQRITSQNGQLFQVGDGLSAAVLTLRGGTNIFGNGLRISTGGVLEGSGVVSGAVTNQGSISPGTNNVGRLDLTGTLEFLPSSAFAVGIGGSAPGITHDLLVVSNTATLSGNLQLSLTNRFLPQPGDVFTFLSAGSRIGEFANAPQGSRLFTTDGLGSFMVSYTANSVVLGQFDSPDTDGDGQSDYAESLAGTDLADPLSAFRIIRVDTQPPRNFAVRFNAEAGQTYGVEYSDDMQNWFQVNAPTFSNPASGELEWVDDGSLTGGVAPLLLPDPRHYRIVLY